MKEIFNWTVDQFTWSDNILINFIIAAIVGLIGFKIAFYLVGRLYDEGVISGSASGHVLHWIIRLAIVSGIYVALGAVIWMIKLIASVPFWVWLCIIVVSVIVLISTFVLKISGSKSENDCR
jgi:hypothetical protein